jgi:hypothetical protein
MKNNKTYTSYASRHPITMGMFVVVGVVGLGIALALSTGFTTPAQTHAQEDPGSGLDRLEGNLDGGYVDGDPSSIISDGVSDVTSDGDSDPGVDNSSPVSTAGDTGTSAISNGDTSSDAANDAATYTDSTPPSDAPAGDINDSDTEAPCDCGGDADTYTDTTPEIDAPAGDINDSDTEAPCDCGGEETTPEETTPPIETPPIIVTTPIVIPPTTPTCAAGYTGTYPDCIPPSPPPTCATGDTGTYPDCIPPTTPVCPSGDTGTYPDCVTPTPPCTIDCQTGGGGGGGGGSTGGGGGGGSTGGIIFSGGGGGGSTGQIVSQVVAPAPVASMVYLSQIPYTGLDLGPVGTVLYWILLVLICAAAAYLSIFSFIPWIYKALNSWGDDVGDMLNPSGGFAMAGASGAGAHGSSAHAQSNAHDVGAGYNPHANVPASPYTAGAPSTAINPATMQHNQSAYSSAKGFASFAQGNTLTIDDIVNGLARLPEVQDNHGEAATHLENGWQPTPVAPAHSQPVAAFVAPAAPQSHMEQPSRKEMATAQISTDVRDFCAALLSGNRDVVFGTLRQIVREGGDAEMFLTQVVCALDDAYRSRVDGTKVNPEIAQLTKNCATAFLERLTSALTNAVDSSYSPGITGSKLALTRALAVVEG